MKNPWPRRIVSLALMGALVGSFSYVFRDKPVPVDIAQVDRGSVEIVIGEEGSTRIRDVYKVFAPVAGRIDRVPLNVGDTVTQGLTMIAEIHPVQPPFQDVRIRRDLEANLQASAAAVELAEAEVRRRQSEYALSKSELHRKGVLYERNFVSQAAYDQALAEFQSHKAILLQALASLKMKRSQRDGASARLMDPNEGENPHAGDCCVTVAAPHNGVVLSVLTKSEQVVAQGAPLAEIGDPNDLEIVVDLLSTDAVQISAGDSARVIGWGGDHALQAVVRRLDPVGFTKVSALGIEEQRVNAVLDLNSAPEEYDRLDHAFRVYVEVIVDQNKNVVRVPLGALFRDGREWAVFRIENGIAKLVHVTLGDRNTRHAIVVTGLEIDDLLILHPSDKIESGLTIEDRSGEYADAIPAPYSIWKDVETFLRNLLAATRDAYTKWAS